MAHELAALDAALLSGVLARVFGEEVALTIRGRTRSSDFNFYLQNTEFPISGVQIEVDGGYEGATTINLVEAKIGSRNNLSIRQILYPQLAWSNAVGNKKGVNTFICFYQEPMLRFIPVKYENGICVADSSGSVFILGQEAELDLQNIRVAPDASPPILGAPFPQADKFETVLAMFSIVMGNEEMPKDLCFQDFEIAS